MDRRRIELQIRAVLVAYRGEQRRHDADVMDAFRARATSILDELEPLVTGDADLERRLEDARALLDGRVPRSEADAR